jgi:hypothetical protein
MMTALALTMTIDQTGPTLIKRKVVAAGSMSYIPVQLLPLPISHRLIRTGTKRMAWSTGTMGLRASEVT